MKLGASGAKFGRERRITNDVRGGNARCFYSRRRETDNIGGRRELGIYRIEINILSFLTNEGDGRNRYRY